MGDKVGKNRSLTFDRLKERLAQDNTAVIGVPPLGIFDEAIPKAEIPFNQMGSRFCCIERNLLRARRPSTVFHQSDHSPPQPLSLLLMASASPWGHPLLSPTILRQAVLSLLWQQYPLRSALFMS